MRWLHLVPDQFTLTSADLTLGQKGGSHNRQSRRDLRGYESPTYATA